MAKVDWETYERRARATLRAYAAGELLGTQACRVLDEALAAATGRGNELPLHQLDWETDSELFDTAETRDSFWK